MSEVLITPLGTDIREDKPVVVIDLGKQKKRNVKRLRKGQGRLMADIQDAIAGLRAQGTIGLQVEPVVIVVRQKNRRKKKARSLFGV